MRRNTFFVLTIVAAACAPGPVLRAQSPTSQPTSQPADAPLGNSAGQLRIDQLLDVHLLRLQLGFEGSYDQRRVEFDSGDRPHRVYRQRNRAVRLEETLGLESSGALLGERVMLFDFAIDGGWSQESFDEDGPGYEQHSSPSGDLFNYDLTLDLFPRGKVSGTVYAQRQDSRVPRAFQPSLDRTLERYGAGLYFNDRALPMRLTFEHTWDELASRTLDELDDEQRGRDTLRYEATWQIDPHQALRFDYEYDDRRELYSGNATCFDTTRHYLTADHVLRFGPEHKSSWQTLARFQDETGDLARDMAEASTRLRLQVTDALATHFGAQFLRDSFQELRTETWRGEAGVHYQIADGLSASADFYGLQTQQDENADFSEWGSVATVDFSRENPWGRFSASVTYNHTTTDTRNGDRGGIVIGESVTLRDPLASFLAHTDVNLASILVTDANRTRTYLPVRDYMVLPMGRYVAIKRVATGQIADRATVMVSYTYRTLRDYELCRDRIDVRVQQVFKWGLTPYYAGSIQDEDVDQARYLGFQARNINRHRIGATLRRRSWSAGVEYEYHHDALDPYQAVHGNGDVIMWQTPQNQLDGRASASQFWFEGNQDVAKRDTFLLDCGLSYRHLLSRGIELNAEAMYRFEDDSIYGTTHGVDLSGRVEWRIGQFTLLFETEYDLLDLPGSRDDGFSVWLKLRRYIPVIAREKAR